MVYIIDNLNLTHYTLHRCHYVTYTDTSSYRSMLNLKNPRLVSGLFTRSISASLMS